MAQGKTLLILGGGIVAASQLRRTLSHEHRVENTGVRSIVVALCRHLA